MIPLPTLESFVSQLAGTSVQIACDSPATEGGHVDFDGWIHLTPTICYRLQHPMGNAAELGTSALLLTHEAEHIVLHDSGQDGGDEGQAECHAITDVRATIALIFRFPMAYATRALSAAYAFHGGMPATYRTVC